MSDTTSGPGFVLSGYRAASSTYYQGSFGYYWTASATNDARYASDLFLGSSIVYPASSDLKYLGFSVRCVAK